MTETTPVLEVERADIGATRLVTDELGDLVDGQVRLRIDRFAVTANTVTYAQFGDVLGYWDFFPTDDAAWGRVPAMGWAEVVASANPDIEVGGRYYGWFPMAGLVDVTVSPTGDGLRDDGPHRIAHAGVYRSFVDTRRDALYPQGVDDPDELGDLEDRHALLRGLFLTGFLADAWFASKDWFGAETAVVLSASSKTAIGFAHCAARRGLGSLVGVTSAGNVDFVRDLGLYDEVVTYDDVGALAVTDAVAIDMAGNAPAVAALHERFGNRLAHSMAVGRSHVDAPPAEVTTGPTPELFFAPTAMTALAEDGADLGDLLGDSVRSLHEFVDGSRAWLTVERTAGPEATQATWTAVHAGQVPPKIGRITSLHG